jgi:hypothetical protein
MSKAAGKGKRQNSDCGQNKDCQNELWSPWFAQKTQVFRRLVFLNRLFTEIACFRVVYLCRTICRFNGHKMRFLLLELVTRLRLLGMVRKVQIRVAAHAGTNESAFRMGQQSCFAA